MVDKYLIHLSWVYHLWNGENSLYLLELLLGLEKKNRSENLGFVLIDVTWPIHTSSFLPLPLAWAAFPASR